MPVEMLGLTEFPRIGDQPYFLTLGPVRLLLVHAAAATAAGHARRRDGTGRSERSDRRALPALLVGVDWESVLDSGTRAVLERQALRPVPPAAALVRVKSREIRQARFTDWATLRTGAHAGVPRDRRRSSTPTAGPRATCCRSRCSTARRPTRALNEQRRSSVLARVTGARKGVLVDGFIDDDTCERLLATDRAARETADRAWAACAAIADRRPHAMMLRGANRRWVRSGTIRATASRSSTIATC